MGVADDASVGEADDARGVFQQALVVGGEDEGEAEAAVEVAHQVDELGGVARVEVGGGLVGEHQGGTMDDGAGDGYALAFAAGEQVGPMAGAGGKADICEGFGNALAALARADALDEQRILDVFAGREDGDQVEGLKDEADLFAAEESEVCEGLSREVSVPSMRMRPLVGLSMQPIRFSSVDLPLPLGPEMARNSPASMLEADVVEGSDGAVVKGKSAGDLVNADEWVGWSHRGLSFPERYCALERKIAGVRLDCAAIRMRGRNGG